MKNKNWQELYDIARERLNPRNISPFIKTGGVASAILTEDGNVYTGINIDTDCGLGMCAERNAISNMLTTGESKIVKLVCVKKDGSIGSSCGACREFLMQLDSNSGEIELLIDLNNNKVVKLKDLIPNWWGENKH